MRAFDYERPRSLDEAVALLAEHGSEAHLLAGGTDLVIGLRDGWIRPSVVIDIKQINELTDAIRIEDGRFIISATAVMTDLEEHEAILEHLPALAEAARVVGSVQIRNRATLVGNICNASPAADTAPPLLVHDAVMVIAGPDGVRKVPIDDFILGPGQTDLGRGELVIAIEVPIPSRPFGAAYTRMTRRRGTDLASVTLCCGVYGDGTTSLSFGSVGPRPFLVVDESGALADPETPEDERNALLDGMFARASPSLTSIRAGPDYRLAMLRVLGARALQAALDRLRGSM
jgi:carbon-monoxide dehydrogenase medium subunit